MLGANEIIRELEQSGFYARFLPISALDQVREHYDSLLARGPDTSWMKGTIENFRKHQPPKLDFEPKSIIVIAQPSVGGTLVLNRGGEAVKIPTPPNCVTVTPPERWIENVLPGVSQGWQLAHTKGLSLKLLAALSGLGQYGRNNICYVGDWGSYVLLHACYTDIPWDGPVCTELRMAACENCGACRKACPTKAIGETQVIDASRCLAHANNGRGRIPRWVPKGAHHALVECLRCQACCPQNPPADFSHSLELDGAETKRLLSRSKKMPEDLAQKFKQFGMGSWNMAVLKRNARLAVQAKEA